MTPPPPTQAAPPSRARELADWPTAFGAVALCELAVRFGILGTPGQGRLGALVGWQVGIWCTAGLLLGAGCSLLGRATRGARVPAALALGAWCALWASSSLPLRLAWALPAGLVPGVLAALAVHRALARASTRALRAGLAIAIVAALAGLSAGRVAEAPDLPAASAEQPGGPSVLLVTIDTLRADRVGAYGHAAARTPVLDALAAEGVLFENAVTASVWTGPSHATILSGRLPAEHGLHENLQTLRPSLPTLADVLGERGYRTGAIVASAPVSERGSRLPGRFARYDDDLRAPGWPPPELLETVVGRLGARALGRRAMRLRALWRPAERVTDRALDWLAEEDGAPFFGWVHYFDPHLPYRAPASDLDEGARAWSGPVLDDWGPLPSHLKQEVRSRPEWLAHMGRLYDAEVAHVDRELGRLLTGARERAGGAGLWIVVTADHGESFGEHELYFSRDLYEPSLRVPLILVPPRGADETIEPGTRVVGVVQLVDLAATVLDIVGASGALETDGVSLLPALRDPETAPGRPAVASILNLHPEQDWPSAISVRTERWKSIWRLARGSSARPGEGTNVQELYDVERDPHELNEVSRAHPDVDGELWPVAKELGTPRVIEQRELGEIELEALRGLGYAR